MNKFILLFIILFSLNGRAQESVNIGHQYSIYSKVLNEKRTYSVALPQSYSQTKFTPVSYPVLLLLDGESSFEFVEGIVKFLSKGISAAMPEMIVVAVHNTNRTRDYTPTASSIASPDDKKKILFQESGGLTQFTQFITDELLPGIEKNFRTNEFKILIGHSFGGLAVTNIFLNHPKIFKACIAIDPSYWWDNGYTIEQLERRIFNPDFQNNQFILAHASNQGKPTFAQHDEFILEFKNLMDSASPTQLYFNYTFYQTENHGTIALPAIYHGLKDLFKDYAFDFKTLSGEMNRLQNHYEQLSKKIHFPIKPEEPKLHFIYQYYLRENHTKAAADALAFYQKLYPKTAPVN